VTLRAYFRFCRTTDPEERLEEAALWKALHDLLEDRIEPLEPGAVGMFGVPVIGRPHITERGDELRYWTDPAFLASCGRAFHVCSFEDLPAVVELIHGIGRGAFVKSTKAKHAIVRIPVGMKVEEAFGDMAYSFIDGGPELMVQELCEVRYEHRFFVVDRRIVTHTPNAAHLTPLDHVQCFSFETPADHEPSLFYAGGFLQGVAEQIARKMRTPDAVIDCAIINGRPAAVELNPMILGGVGLFACDVRRLALAVIAKMGLL
jgi:hypothetical protein